MDKNNKRTIGRSISFPYGFLSARSDFITVLDGKMMITLNVQLWEMLEGKISKVKAGDKILQFTLVETEEDIKQDIKQDTEEDIEQVDPAAPKVVAPGPSAPAAGSLLNTGKKYKKHRAPANTARFLTWLDDRKDPNFVLGDIVKETFLSKDSALKIVEYQLKIGKLQQISKWEFARRK